MSLILIIGISTSGKSAVALELQKRGYEAYDTEHNGSSAWYNKETGERVAEFGEMTDRTPEWSSQHHWLMSKDWVAEMAVSAKDKNIFLCGGASNATEIRKLCDKVIWLKTDEDTIRRRVNNARDHDYGTKPHELTKTIENNLIKEAEFTAYGAILIDARQPLDEVVDEILAVM